MFGTNRLARAITGLAATAAAVVSLNPAAAAPAAQGAGPTPVAAPLTGQINVYAAASLRDAFTEIGKNFEAANPGTKVTFNFAGSQQLAEQIGFGAPADVFASANTRLMDAVVKTGRVDHTDPRTFVRNRLVVVYPTGNPGRLRALRDLARPGLTLVLANKTVPVGGYSLDFLNKATTKPEFGATFSQTVLANVASYEEDVRAVFNKVALGEADAGIVYRSDVVADEAQAVGTIDIPSDLNTIATYPIAALKDRPNRPLAQAFTRFVLSPAAQMELVKYGFVSTTGDATGAAPRAGTLLIGGLVNRPSTLQGARLRSLKQTSVQATDRDGAEENFAGPTLDDVLRLAGGVQSGAKTVTFTGGDGYSQDVPLAELAGDAAIITFDENGALRNIIPAKAPRYWVKGLIKIDVN
jgi:molybdate transport system substrate-binding protein